MTQMCCDTTARQAFHRGYAVDFLSDATGTLSVTNAAGTITAGDLHKAVLITQQMLFSRVLSTDEWIRKVTGEQKSHHNNFVFFRKKEKTRYAITHNLTADLVFMLWILLTLLGAITNPGYFIIIKRSYCIARSNRPDRHRIYLRGAHTFYHLCDPQIPGHW